MACSSSTSTSWWPAASWNAEFITVRDGQLVETQVFFGGRATQTPPLEPGGVRVDRSAWLSAPGGCSDQSLSAFLTGTITLLLAPHTAYGVVLVALAVIAGCWLGVGAGAASARGYEAAPRLWRSIRRWSAVALEPPLRPLFILRAAVVSLNGLAALVLVAELTGLSPTDGEGAQNRWATDSGRLKERHARER